MSIQINGSNLSMPAAALCVTAAGGIGALDRYGPQIDRLNRESARPNGFLTAGFLYTFALRNEWYTPGQGERLFLVWEGEQLIGAAAMRRSVEVMGPGVGPLALRSIRLGFLAAVDIEQPGLLCKPQDEDRVAAALINHLCTREPAWGMLEFVGQRPGSALHRAAHAATDRRFRVRDIEVDPYNEIALTWPDLAGYFKGLVKKMRSNISRQARALYAAGKIELVFCEGPQACTAWFAAYCDLDRRSWKGGTESSIERHPRRIRFYRDVVAGRAGLEPSFIGVILDDVLVAGIISAGNTNSSPENHGTWCLEMSYDATRADLGPGNLLLLLSVGDAIARGDKFLNWLQMFAYYKHRWKADPINVVNVQMLRQFSLHDLRGRLGELKKKLQRGQAAVPAAAATSGAEEEEAAPAATAAPAVPATPVAAPPSLDQARALTAAACAYAGAGMRILDREKAQAYLPFALK